MEEAGLTSPAEDFYTHEPLAIDFETTGFKKHPNNALTLSMVIVDDQLPFNKRPKLNLIFLHKVEDVQDVAITMNAHIFAARSFFKVKKPEEKTKLLKLYVKEIIEKAETICKEYVPVQSWDEAREKIDEFLNLYYGENTPTLLGKNIENFDRGFFPEDINGYFAAEVIDVGDYWRSKTDADRGHSRNPGIEECCRRAGIDPTVHHDSFLDNCQNMQLWELGIAQRNRTNP
jgi:DNA polymerase III epsilon subunit-like protein